MVNMTDDKISDKGTVASNMFVLLHKDCYFASPEFYRV